MKWLMFVLAIGLSLLCVGWTVTGNHYEASAGTNYHIATGGFHGKFSCYFPDNAAEISFWRDGVRVCPSLATGDADTAIWIPAAKSVGFDVPTFDAIYVTRTHGGSTSGYLYWGL